MEGEALLTSEEQERYMALQSLFRQPGWGIIVRELEESIQSTPEESFWKAKTFEDILVQRIRVQERTVLVRYPDLVEQRTQQIILQRSQLMQDANEGMHE